MAPADAPTAPAWSIGDAWEYVSSDGDNILEYEVVSLQWLDHEPTYLAEYRIIGEEAPPKREWLSVDHLGVVQAGIGDGPYTRWDCNGGWFPLREKQVDCTVASGDNPTPVVASYTPETDRIQLDRRTLEAWKIDVETMVGEGETQSRTEVYVPAAKNFATRDTFLSTQGPEGWSHERLTFHLVDWSA